MEIKQLTLFLKAAETLNFAEASRQLFITQGAFTQSIKQLEEELGLPLFDRNSHYVHLTEAGEVLVHHARMTLNAADECRSAISDLTEMKMGILRIGVTHSFSLMVTGVLSKFCKQYPNIKIEITYKRMEELLLMLHNHELDCVLSYKPLNKPHQIESTCLFHDRLGVVMRKDHSLAGNQSLKLQDISHYSLVLPAKGLQARNVLDKILSDTDIVLNTRVEFNIATPILRLVRDSKMLSLLSCTSVKTFPELTTVPLDEENSEMMGCVHTLSKCYRKHSLDCFVDMLQEYIKYNGLN